MFLRCRLTTVDRHFLFMAYGCAVAFELKELLVFHQRLSTTSIAIAGNNDIQMLRTDALQFENDKRPANPVSRGAVPGVLLSIGLENSHISTIDLSITPLFLLINSE